MKFAVLGSSGDIGGKVIEELLSDGVDVRRGLRTGAGAPHFDISDRTGATRFIAWAGRRFRDALFSAVGMDPDQTASVLSAAAGNGVVPGCEVLAHATDGIDEVGVRVASMTTLCAAMAVSCVKVLGGLGTAGMTALPQQLTALDLLLRTGTAVGQVIETAGGVITRVPDEEGEL